MANEVSDRTCAKATVAELVQQAGALIPPTLLDRLPPSEKLHGEPEKRKPSAR
jgi:hypothetical protein